MESSSAAPLSSCSPITRIPTELLTQIFCHVPSIEFEESLQPSVLPPLAPTPIPSWIAITQVCQQWRTIASSCKEFWSYIPLHTSEYWVENSLARSYPYPISLRIDISHNPTIGPQAGRYRRRALTTLKKISRARQVALYISARGADLLFRKEALGLLDVSPAPFLETLNIQAGTTNNISPSGDIFLRHVPTALHALNLTCCDVGPSSLLFRAPLVTLCLENCRMESPLEVLSLLPHLQSLVLKNTDCTGFNDSDDVLVRLPQLQHLELTTTSNVIVLFLKGILTPASVSLSITCTDYKVQKLTPLRTIILTLSPVLSTYLERALEEGHVCHYLDFLEITKPSDHPSSNTLALLSPASLTRLHLSFIWHDVSGSTDLDFFSEMLSALPTAALKHVHTLRMRSDGASRSATDARLHAYFWTHICNRHKARDEAMQRLLATVTQHRLLPALRQVSLEGMNIDKFDLAYDLFQRQRKMTSERTMIRLSLRDCLISQDTIAALRDCLGMDAVELV